MLRNTDTRAHSLIHTHTHTHTHILNSNTHITQIRMLRNTNTCSHTLTVFHKHILRIHTHTNTHTQAYTHSNTHITKYTCSHTLSHTHSCTHWIHTHTHALHKHLDYRNANSEILTHTHSHALTHTHTHTEPHTDINSVTQSCWVCAVNHCAVFSPALGLSLNWKLCKLLKAACPCVCVRVCFYMSQLGPGETLNDSQSHLERAGPMGSKCSPVSPEHQNQHKTTLKTWTQISIARMEYPSHIECDLVQLRLTAFKVKGQVCSIFLAMMYVFSSFFLP